MRRFVTVTMLAAAALLLAYGVVGTTNAGDPKAAGPDGQALFEANKCNMCHSVKAAGIEAKVKSEKMQGPDLTGIGNNHEIDFLIKFVKKETQLEGETHKGTFKGSDDELKAVIDWLDGLEKE